MEKGDDPYEILGVEVEASADDIRKAYRKMALKHHPDRQLDDTARAEAQSQFAKISGAYEILSNENTRIIYDASQREASAHTSASTCDVDVSSSEESETEWGEEEYTERTDNDFTERTDYDYTERTNGQDDPWGGSSHHGGGGGGMPKTSNHSHMPKGSTHSNAMPNSSSHTAKTNSSSAPPPPATNSRDTSYSGTTSGAGPKRTSTGWASPGRPGQPAPPPPPPSGSPTGKAPPRVRRKKKRKKKKKKKKRRRPGFDPTKFDMSFRSPYEVWKRDFEAQFGFPYPGDVWDFDEHDRKHREKEKKESRFGKKTYAGKYEPAAGVPPGSGGAYNNNNNSRGTSSSGGNRKTKPAPPGSKRLTNGPLSSSRELALVDQTPSSGKNKGKPKGSNTNSLGDIVVRDDSSSSDSGSYVSCSSSDEEVERPPPPPTELIPQHEEAPPPRQPKFTFWKKKQPKENQLVVHDDGGDNNGDGGGDHHRAGSSSPSTGPGSPRSRALTLFKKKNKTDPAQRRASAGPGHTPYSPKKRDDPSTSSTAIQSWKPGDGNIANNTSGNNGYGPGAMVKSTGIQGDNRPLSMNIREEVIQHPDGTVERLTHTEMERPDGSKDIVTVSNQSKLHPDWKTKSDKPKLKELTNGEEVPQKRLTNGEKSPRKSSDRKQASAKSPPSPARKLLTYGGTKGEDPERSNKPRKKDTSSSRNSSEAAASPGKKKKKKDMGDSEHSALVEKRERRKSTSHIRRNGYN